MSPAKPRRLTHLGQLSDPDIRLLRIFHAVVANGGFTAAAADLGLTRSTVSIHMDTLESRLGFVLCRRGRAGFSLTTEGQNVYDASLSLFSAIDSFRDHVNNSHAFMRGDLNIGITDNFVTFPGMRISDSLTALRHLSNDIRINVSMEPSGLVERGVLTDRLHLGVIPLTKPTSTLTYFPLYEEFEYLYCSAEHPLFCVPDACIDATVLLSYDSVRPLYPLSPSRQIQQQKLSSTATATNREGVALLILTGSFLGFLPDHFALHWIRSSALRAIRPNDHFSRTSYALVTKPGHIRNRILTSFLEIFHTSQ